MKIHGTAKGGALSTKDFGVAFGGGAAALVTIYEHTTTPNVDAFFNTGDTYAGFSITGSSPAGVIGSIPRRVTFYLKKHGSPTAATMTARVCACADVTDVKIQFDTLSTAGITTDFQEFEFNEPTATYELQAGDAVVIFMPVDVFPDRFAAGGTNPAVDAGQKLANGNESTGACAGNQTIWIKIAGIAA